MQVVVFTGHRHLPLNGERKIREAVRRRMVTADEFVFGGAIGADMVAL